jgi:hypothetical protein
VANATDKFVVGDAFEDKHVFLQVVVEVLFQNTILVAGADIAEHVFVVVEFHQKIGERTVVALFDVFALTPRDKSCFEKVHQRRFEGKHDCLRRCPLRRL